MFNIFYRISDVTFGTFPVYKPFKNMGKSTQKVDIASSQQPAPVAASSQQPTKKMLFYIFNIFYRVSDVTFGTFPVYKPFKNMGKSTQKVDIASSQQPAPVGARASSQQPTQKMLIFYLFNIFYRISDVTFGTFPVYKPFKNMGKSTQKVDIASSQQPAPVAASSQ